MYLYSFILTTLTTILTKNSIIKMLSNTRLKRENYNKKSIVTSAGLTLIIPFIVGVFPFLLYTSDGFITLFILSTILTAFSGFLDDIVDDNASKGFRGHMKSLLNGQLTTGILKIVFTVLAAFLISISISNTISQIILNVLIYCLFVNLINILDLRPGRAIKSYFLFYLIVFLTVQQTRLGFILIPTLIPVIFILKDDFTEKVMLGDIGSNVLGSVLGFIATIGLSIDTKIILLFVLVLIHFYAEKYSITKTINKYKLLKLLDMIGRKKV